MLLDIVSTAAPAMGNVVKVEKEATKTAIQINQCSNGEMIVDDRYDIRTAEGKQVPLVRTTYKLLGQPMDGQPGNIASRAKSIVRARTNIAMVAQLGGMGRDLAASIWDGQVGSLALTFGAGPTPTGWEGAEEIEVTKRKSLAGMGERAWKGSRAQVYARQDQGGMGIRHAYAHTGGATISIVDRALTSHFGQPHALAMQSGILLTSWRFGWVSTHEHRTPLDWRPERATEQMNTDYIIQAWWMALEMARLRTRHTSSNSGSGEPLDPSLQLYKPTCDGGGPMIWGRQRPVFLELSQIGVVRAADMYGGKDSRGKGRWRYPNI